MKDFIIVIGRQYGAGGRRLGRMLADKLGVPYYDKELLAQAAEEFGISKEIFMKADEKKPSALRSFLSLNYGSPLASFSSYALTNDNLYRAQSEVIKAVSKKGSCVIVGRTADYVLRNHPQLISVFIHAPEDVRAKALCNSGEEKDYQTALDKTKQRDRERESYYNYFTNRSWGRADNYDLTFNSAVIPLETIVDMIEAKLS